jgi:hypothetical protein
VRVYAYGGRVRAPSQSLIACGFTGLLPTPLQIAIGAGSSSAVATAAGRSTMPAPRTLWAGMAERSPVTLSVRQDWSGHGAWQNPEMGLRQPQLGPPRAQNTPVTSG